MQKKATMHITLKNDIEPQGPTLLDSNPIISFNPSCPLSIFALDFACTVNYPRSWQISSSKPNKQFLSEEYTVWRQQ